MEHLLYARHLSKEYRDAKIILNKGFSNKTKLWTECYKNQKK